MMTDIVETETPTESADSGSSKAENQGDSEDRVVDSSPDPPTTPQVRKSTKVKKPTARYSPSANFLLLTENREPLTYSEAISVRDSVQWEHAMKEEMKSLEKNHTWVLTKLTAGKKALQNKWVFRVKDEHNGTKRFKARMVVKGVQQKEGVTITKFSSQL
ncbi:hypothetical protein SSX86_011415 [Deinandra increscens subsp. villosa]|uniref:Reverse transcriptase Ty1/copia-type domain-containing protein n=1 Tax=Deinandra increscens subsp. villosa TaxID=3103831 RepID=A0AAP0H1Z3_9ASTR